MITSVLARALSGKGVICISALALLLAPGWRPLERNRYAVQVAERALLRVGEPNWCEAGPPEPPAGWQARGIPDAFWRARALFVSGQESQAFEIWRGMGAFEYFMNAGKLYLDRRDARRALRCFELARKVAPERADTWYGLSIARHVGGDPRAVLDLDRAASLGVATIPIGRFYQYYLEASDIYEKAKRWAQAITLAEYAARKSPRWAVPLAKLAVYYDHLDDSVRSQHYLEAAKEADPSDFWPWLAQGDIERRHGQRDAARSSFLRAMGLGATRDEPVSRLVDLYVSTGELDQALVLLNGVVAKQGDRDLAFYYLGWIYGLQRRYLEAVRAYQVAVRLKPGDARYSYDLAQALDALGQRHLAGCYYLRARDLAPLESSLREQSSLRFEASPRPDNCRK